MKFLYDSPLPLPAVYEMSSCNLSANNQYCNDAVAQMSWVVAALSWTHGNSKEIGNIKEFQGDSKEIGNSKQIARKLHLLCRHQPDQSTHIVSSLSE